MYSCCYFLLINYSDGSSNDAIILPIVVNINHETKSIDVSVNMLLFPLCSVLNLTLAGNFKMSTN